MQQTLIHKPADSSAPLHDVIRERWSPRSFSELEISDEDLRTVLEAGRWAASSYNEQPWRFLVARKKDKAAFQTILSLLMPQNAAWAKKASVLMITAAKKAFTHSGSPNYYHLHDTGAATANMFLQAAALGFQAHGMGGYDHKRAQQELHIPEDYAPGAALAFGYAAPAEELELDENYRQMERAPRQRKALAEIAYLGEWNQTLAFSHER